MSNKKINPIANSSAYPCRNQESLKKEEKDFFTQDKFWDFLWHMAFALQYLHQVIHKPHGSVNPHNIFGVEKDGRVCWKLAKYGLRMTKDEYRAPEVGQLDYYVISRTSRPFGPLVPCSSSLRMGPSVTGNF